MRLDLPASHDWLHLTVPAGLSELDYAAAQRIHGRWTCRPHRLRRPHLALVRTGVLALCAEGLAFAARGGQALLLPAGTRIETDPAPSGGSLTCWFGFARRAVATWTTELLPDHGARLLGPDPEAVEAGFACFHALRTGRDPLLVRGLLLRCLGLWREAAARADTATACLWLPRVLEHLRAYPEDDDLARLQRLAGVSRSAFHEGFRRATGTTPHDHIVRLRVRLAAALLRSEPYLPLAEVADRSGFGSSDAFRRAFRRHHGCSPGVWRNGG